MLAQTQFKHYLQLIKKHAIFATYVLRKQGSAVVLQSQATIILQWSPPASLAPQQHGSKQVLLLHSPKRQSLPHVGQPSVPLCAFSFRWEGTSGKTCNLSPC